MNGRERILSAINHKVTDKIPTDFGGTSVTGIHAMAYRNLIEQKQERKSAFPTVSQIPIKKRNIMQEIRLKEESIMQEIKLKEEISLFLDGLKEFSAESYYANIDHQRMIITFHYFGCIHWGHDKIILTSEEDLMRLFSLRNSGYKVRQCSKCILTDPSKIIKSLPI